MTQYGAGGQHLGLQPGETARNVGSRHGKPVVLRIDIAGALAQELPFFLADNGVWLTTHVPSTLLSIISDEETPGDAQ